MLASWTSHSKLANFASPPYVPIYPKYPYILMPVVPLCLEHPPTLLFHTIRRVWLISSDFLTSCAGCPANALSPQLSVPTLEAMLRSFQRNVDRKGYAAAVKAVEQDAARALGAAMDNAADTETDTVAVTRVPAAPAPATATATVAAPAAVASAAVASVASVGPARQVSSAPSSPVRGEAAETVRPAKSYVAPQLVPCVLLIAL